MSQILSADEAGFVDVSKETMERVLQHVTSAPYLVGQQVKFHMRIRGGPKVRSFSHFTTMIRHWATHGYNPGGLIGRAMNGESLLEQREYR